MTDPVLSRHRAEILRLAHEHGATEVRVFGSRARGEGNEASDIDLLVELEVGRSLLDLIGLQHAIEDLTHLEVDALTPNGLSPYLRETILAEAIPL
ncbi:MAG: nucleotidyltransferase family protein [Thermoanaerobaculia bacterium]|nr:nucleotidyltransferase family protein [Thermoanaerobaculia bacterium]